MFFSHDSLVSTPLVDSVNLKSFLPPIQEYYDQLRRLASKFSRSSLREKVNSCHCRTPSVFLVLDSISNFSSPFFSFFHKLNGLYSR